MNDFVLLPVLVVDLDGTIRFNGENPVGFINRAEEVAVFDDVEPKLWEYRDAGYLIFGATNQGGVAHGYKSVADVEAEIEATRAHFERDPFHDIRAAYSMSSGSVEPFNHRSLLRKPEIGMLALLEADQFQRGNVIDWEHSLMVGNGHEDEEFAKKAGIAFQYAQGFFGRSK